MPLDLHRRPWLIRLIALAAGAALPLAFAPFGVYGLAIASLTVIFLLLAGADARRAWRLGYLFGLGYFAVGVSWVHISIHEYGGSPLAAAIVVAALLVAFLALFPALAAWLTVRLGAERRALRLLVVGPAAWVLAEWVRSWMLTGFPWLTVGYSQIDSPLRGYADLLGVYGISLVVALTAGALAAVVTLPGWQRFGPLVLIGLLWAGALTGQLGNWTQPTGEVLQVSLIQGNIPQDQKWQRDQRLATLERYMHLTRREWSDGADKADVVIWPETAIPAFFHQVEEGFLKQLRREANTADTDMLVGIPVLDRQQWEYYNAMLRVGQGAPDFYYKRHLVPFGEYLPLRRWLGSLLQVMPLPVADFSAGDDNQTLLKVRGHPVGISICYEVIFGEEVIDTLPEAALLVNVSNDAWFGDSLAPHQHLQMARMRALESGRYLLRATNTGISAVIDPEGRVIARGPQFEVATVRAEVQPRTGATPYVRWGNVTVLALVSILLLLGYSLRRPARRSNNP